MTDNIAKSKTQALRREEVLFSLIDPNPKNPNEMSEAEFNLLYDNFEKTGFTDPLLLWARPNGRFMMIGGHHRMEIAKLHDMDRGPATIIDDPDFDEDQAAFQTVRMNVIRGRMTPQKFMALYQGLSEKYSREVLKEAFGFAEEEEFRKLLKQVEAGIPKEMVPAFKAAAKNAKSIEDLSSVLNKLFTKYGSTLDHGYMLIDYGGKESIWLRVDKQTYGALLEFGELCRANARSMDAMLGGLLQLVAAGKLDAQVASVVASTKPVIIPENTVELPTEDFLASLESAS